MRKRLTPGQREHAGKQRFSIRRRPGVIILALLAAVATTAWFRWMSPTRIAFINFNENRYAQIVEANDSRFIRIRRFSPQEATHAKLRAFAAVYYMRRSGQPTTAESTRIIKQLGRGTAFLVFSSAGQRRMAATNLDRSRASRLRAYLKNGGLDNLRSFLYYNRRVIDGKVLFAGPFAKPQNLPTDVFYHPVKQRFFESYDAYQAWYAKTGLFRPSQARVAVVTFAWGLNSAVRGYVGKLVALLEKRGINVYPIAGRQKRLEFIAQAKPDLILTTALGRLGRKEGQRAVSLLKELNTPLLHPVDIYRPRDQWQQDQRGITGGLLSQQIVIPEMDGASDPLTISAFSRGNDEYLRLEALPGRPERLVGQVQRWLILRRKSNADKRVAIFYFKGPGQNTLHAAGLDVIPSLLNLLRHLQQNGFDTGPLPATANDLAKRIQRQGPVLAHYAKGALTDFLRNGNPELISTATYRAWCRRLLPPELYENVRQRYGPAPGEYLSVVKGNNSWIAVPRVVFGNIVLIPQLPPALGDDRFKLVHGVKKPPPHPYIASYLWAREGFACDAIIHFGTHGNLEFTPWKQTALSDLDWPDVLIGDRPHLYLYVINNIGEAVIAKRRAYAVINSHLTPPFTASGLSGQLADLLEAIHDFSHASQPQEKARRRKTVFTIMQQAKLYRDLGIEAFDENSLTDEVMEKIHRYVHGLANEKITSGLYTLGVPYPPGKIDNTVRMMTVGPLAYSMARMDIALGRALPGQVDDPHFFEEKYRHPAVEIIDQILCGQAPPNDFLARYHPAPGGNAEYRRALLGYRDALQAVQRYRCALAQSPAREMSSVINFLSGGYIPPSSGGDAIANPEAVPTGRNLYAVDPERTPTPDADEVGRQMAKEMIDRYRAKNGRYPRKVAITLWGGEFVRSKGAALAMIFYFLGVEPVRSTRGRIEDVRLIPSAVLERPRIDVVVQTSGQFRDIAASRIRLINRAVALSEEAGDAPQSSNYVRQSTLVAEKIMKEKGLSPLEARLFSRARVFGAADGSYGTGIIGLVEAGDRWRSEDKIANRYLKNMGAVYTADHWGVYRPGIFEAVLQQTDMVIHKRSSNVWGPLSLDHVYEFMGGISTAVRSVTGRDPEAYFADLRNRQNPCVQSAREAIWTETRASVTNPKYIRELQKGGAFAAEKFADIFRNTYGWNVTKPAEIDADLWQKLYDVYIEDRLNLGMQSYFRRKNPFALQEMTAVMLETIRKGYWKPNRKVMENLARLHAGLVNDFKPACSGFVCDNAQLRAFISQQLPSKVATDYNAALSRIRTAGDQREIKGIFLKKEVFEFDKAKRVVSQNRSAIFTLLAIVTVFAVSVIISMRRQQG